MPTSPVDEILLYEGEPLPGLDTVEKRRKAMDALMAAFVVRVTLLATQLHSGEIGMDAWYTGMRGEIEGLHVAGLLLSYGGVPSAITAKGLTRVGGQVQAQYQYLQGYARAVQERAWKAVMGAADFYSEQYLAYRSSLYAGPSLGTFYSELAYGLLTQVPGDGQTLCKMNCRCHLEFKLGDVPGLMNVYWRLGEAEHCPDCLRLSATWDPFELWMPLGLAEEWVRWLPRMDAVALHHHDYEEGVCWQSC